MVLAMVIPWSLIVVFATGVAAIVILLWIGAGSPWRRENRARLLVTAALVSFTIAGLGYTMTRPGYVATVFSGGGMPRAAETAIVRAENWRLLDLANGKPVNLDEFRGKVVFLNFWATTCGYCLQEMPSLEVLKDKFQGVKDMAFLFVAFERSQTPVQHYLQTSKLNLPMYLPLEMPPSCFDSPGLPTTYLLDREGGIVFTQIGATDWAEQKVVDLLRSTLAKPAKGTTPSVRSLDQAVEASKDVNSN